jgi:hypothetical protein
MMFTGEVKIEGLEGFFNIANATVSGTVDGTLTSEEGKLTGALKVGEDGATLATNPNDANSYFTLGSDGKLVPAEGATFVLTSKDGEDTIVESDAIEFATSANTKISGTVIAGQTEGAANPTYL